MGLTVGVIGGGAREAAISRSLLLDPRIDQIVAMPGNPGMSKWPKAFVAYAHTTMSEWVSTAKQRRFDLTIVGPEAPLVAGIVDQFYSINLPIVGPNQKTAIMTEGSKIAAYRLCKQYRIPVPQSDVCHSWKEAVAAAEQWNGRCAVKADGPAAGKGVVVCSNQEEAENAITHLGNQYGFPLLVQDLVEGTELSYIVATDGVTVLPLIPARDYKRAGEGDEGPNTGGMGSLAGRQLLSNEDEEVILRKIVYPTLRALVREGCRYRGFLYFGLMKTADGRFVVLEFNARLGDPETTAILALLRRPSFYDIAWATTQNHILGSLPVEWANEVAVNVVLAAEGYPGTLRTGDVIRGIDEAEKTGAVVLPAGVGMNTEGRLLTAGGRVLNVCCVGKTFSEARQKVYQAIRTPIHWPGIKYRLDIGAGL